VASQVVTAEKRYRISLLLDAYGELLTDKQRTFLRHYFEEDLSFGEIAREYGVSRQAIFDSVKHGEESLEHFEQVLGLVRGGWNAWTAQNLSPRAVAQRLEEALHLLNGHGGSPAGHDALEQALRAVIRELTAPPADEEPVPPPASSPTPVPMTVAGSTQSPMEQ